MLCPLGEKKEGNRGKVNFVAVHIFLGLLVPISRSGSVGTYIEGPKGGG